ncbi:nitrile hydratase [Bordetella sp. H567]|uniref:nitrile hydratase subunit beta n=1 Tax=Bordetella sp. H567 TaxID=1697043 RepID=UPI00081CA777|nr:nitrile hydratase subunit beta [Bordetella sp. H567]AOB31747.1 nitrile hydratase [Bordetella sp. H567]
MKLQHSLGGLENLGPVNVEPRVFVQDWEKRIFGIHTVMMAESAHLSGALHRYPVDMLPTAFKETWTWASLRTGAESMQPFDYFKFRYYEKWLMGISQFFIDKGYVTAEEMAQEASFYHDQPDAPLPDLPSKPIRDQVIDYLMRGDSPLRSQSSPPRFVPGQTVTVADPLAADHTRLPGYLRNKKGTVDEVYPDAFEYFCSTGPDGLDGPMPVYRVAFDAADIWGASMCEPNTTIYADLFEVYVLPGDQS